MNRLFRNPNEINEFFTLLTFKKHKNTLKNGWFACMQSWFNNVQLFATLCAVAHQAHLSMGFSRQEYWSGVPLPSPKQNLARCKVVTIPLTPPRKVHLVHLLTE